MAFQKIQDLGCDTTIALGAVDKKTKKKSPTQAEGYYLGSREVDSKFGPSKIHVLQTAEGKVGLWGKTDMDRKLSNVAVGTMVRVTYTNETVPSKKGNDMRVYLIEQDLEDTLEGAIDVSSSDDSSYDADDQSADDDNAAVEEEEEIQAAAPPPAARQSANRASVQALLAKRKQ